MKKNLFLQKLSQLVEAGVLREIDLEFARILNGPEQAVEDEVLLAAALVSYWYRQGNICLTLSEFAGKQVFEDEGGSEQILPGITAPPAEEWAGKLSASFHVGKPGSFKPLILDDSGRLYLQKLWHYERLIGDDLLARAGDEMAGVNQKLLKEGLSRYFPSEDLFELNLQQVAAALAVLQRFSVISGGPGTGKTTTVVRILALLLEQWADAGKKLSIALAAPTGKAAARLKESVQQQKQSLPASEEIREAVPEKAVTLHQLLGARRGSGEYRYTKDNPLPYEVVVIDEASMIDQTMMAKLLEALLPESRLILLGDKDQLASVEAGSVLGDICMPAENRYTEPAVETLRELGMMIPDDFKKRRTKPLTDNITFLDKSYRFGAKSGIGQLAAAINRQEADRSVDILRSAKYSDVRFKEISKGDDIEDTLFSELLKHAQKLVQSGDRVTAIDLLYKQVALCVHRKGFMGAENVNYQLEQLLRREISLSRYQQWYRGRPVMITKNNYTLKLRNGDLGVVWNETGHNPKVTFKGEGGKFREFNPSRLSQFENAYALTVHKSQGSEFERVHIILPAEPSPILTKELLYTAITRARTEITMWGSFEILKHGITSSVHRSSGLREQFWGA